MKTYEKHSRKYPWGSNEVYSGVDGTQRIECSAEPEFKDINDVLVSIDNIHNATYGVLKLILYTLNNTDPNFGAFINDESEPAGILGWISMQETKARHINNLVNEIAHLLGAELK